MGGAQRVIDEDEDEITTVHAGEPLLPPDAVSPVRPRPFAAPRLHGARPPVVPWEETVLLPTDAPAPEAHPLRPSDPLGWGTVVLPGGGHPDRVDPTRVIAVDETEEPLAAISTTARLSLGAPDLVEAVDSTTLTGIHGPAPVEPLPASATAIRGPAPEAWAIPRVGLARPPTHDRPVVAVPTPASSSAAVPGTGGHPIVPVAVRAGGGHAPMPPSGTRPVVISGPYPVVGPTPTGGHPVVARPTPRARGRGRVLVPTGAHPGPRASPDDTRLAWGFLLGVLITVAIVSVAVALGLYLVQ